MDLHEVILWLYNLILRSQQKDNPYYCDCCTTKCERQGTVIVIDNMDQTNPKLNKHKRYKITIEEIT